MNDLLLLTNLLSLAGFSLTLARHILLKRKLLKLKQDMTLHKQEQGINEGLWKLFNARTNKMLRFWQ
ncbi:hypothetical protein MW344_003791 [Vibrio parahaemolyticus]|uniref:Uncharacterized protein n=1 Tax=Vibrio parahaemolyticus TaxID=670 RepID=A0A9Q3YJS9_VIBPH|nr:hypothetical protein [Vibrio parahaemolyticus]EGQ8101959.1 hypothetical protein [Vibrio parahaemolyticus]EGQ8548743.1 hypothetical protein [Vibrio parahaemolyticus]EGQ9073842.1 hypothetical protein [Vibrio parahaemolyticus]EGQ9129665.1 hypothetical protein [Vibrio parahaemolyticus]EGQ9286424.1 hypothetical protein [Vibrio parahaemolyticus]